MAAQIRLKQLVIDTDCGVDDTAAILLALFSAEVNVHALSVVAGNTDAEAGFRLAQLLVSLSKASSKIYLGSKTPLVPYIQTPRWDGHGIDGLGNFSSTPAFKQFERNLENHSTPEQHASLALIDLVNRYPNQYDLLTLGPLTNIAIAISIDPDFLLKWKSITIMGGSMNGLGNSNRTAEFNMKYDPESAFIVFQSSSKLSDIARRPLITIVPWETTLNHSLSWSFLEELRLSKSDKSYFLDCITNLSRTFKDPTPEKSNPWKGDKLDNHKRQLNSFLLPDIYAVIACLYPASIERYDPWSVKIELQGIETRGMTHVNWTSPDDCPNAKIITEMNMPFIKKVMMDCFSDINWPLQANQNQV